MMALVPPRRYCFDDFALTLLIIFLILFTCSAARARPPEGGSAEAGELPFPVKVPFVIGGHFSDYQNYSGVPYLHGGMDLCVPAGAVIYSPAKGTVKISKYRIDANVAPLHFKYLRFPLDTPDNRVWPTNGEALRYVEVAITDSEGKEWMFRHINADGIPPEVKKLDGTPGVLPAGSPIGSVIEWSDVVVPEPGKYNHVHLEIVGSSGFYLNPEVVLTRYPDTIKPQINGIEFVKNEETTAFNGGSPAPVTAGDIDIIADISDRSDGAGYIMSPYRVRYAIYQILPEGKRIAVKPLSDVFLFDRLPIKGDRTQLANVLYKDRVLIGGRVAESNGNGRARRFLMVITNGNPSDGYSPAKSLKTREFPNGFYLVEVEASDLAGNISYFSRKFEIRN